jgi:hypothetical protein
LKIHLAPSSGLRCNQSLHQGLRPGHPNCPETPGSLSWQIALELPARFAQFGQSQGKNGVMAGNTTASGATPAPGQIAVERAFWKSCIPGIDHLGSNCLFR